jgi:hypothetical protein
MGFGRFRIKISFPFLERLHNYIELLGFISHNIMDALLVDQAHVVL